MPFQIDDKALLASIAALPATIARGAEKGLSAVAPVIEGLMQSSPAHGDMSGAAHASSFVAPLGGAQNGLAVADAAYQVAAAHLNGFSGPHGKPARIDVPTLPAGERGLLLGRPIDYGQALEDEGKAVVEPTLAQTSNLILQYASDGIKQELA